MPRRVQGLPQGLGARVSCAHSLGLTLSRSSCRATGVSPLSFARVPLNVRVVAHHGHLSP